MIGRGARWTVLALAGCLWCASPAMAEGADDAFRDALSRGDAMADAGDYRGALEWFERASRSNPDHAGVHVRIAMAAAEAGEREIGRRALERIDALRPDLADDPALRDVREKLRAAPDDAPRAVDEERPQEDRDLLLHRQTAASVAREMLLVREDGDEDRARELARESREYLALGLPVFATGDRQMWQVAAVIALQVPDDDLAAFSFLRLTELAPDFEQHPDARDLVVQLNRRPIRERMRRWGGDAEREAAWDDWRFGALARRMRHELLFHSRAGDVDAVQEIASQGINLHPTLSQAVRDREAAVVKTLLVAGVSLEQINIAVMYSNRDVTAADVTVLDVLLNAGADVNSVGYNTWPILYNRVRVFRIQNSQEQERAFIERLLKAGPSLTYREAESGRGILHMAVRAGDGKLVEMLIEAGAEIHRRDKDGRTPLHEAIEGPAGEASPPVIRALLAAGADTRALDARGDTPLHSAARAGHVWRLGENGLNVLLQNDPYLLAVKDDDGKTPADLALAARGTLSTRGWAILNDAGGKQGYQLKREVKRPYVGLRYTQSGRVDYVVPDLAADQAGLRRGDIIKTVGLDRRPPAEIRDVVLATAPGEPLPLSIERDGQSREIVITVGERTHWE